MSNPSLSLSSRRFVPVMIAFIIMIVAIGTLLALYFNPLGTSDPHGATTAAGEHNHDHEGDDHKGHAHGENAAIQLSAAALKNIGYQPFTLSVGDYERTISLPGIIVERPGKSQIRVSAPLSGVVTRSYVIQGEAIAPGSPLFDVRLTHEELASAQGVYLETAEELEVVNAEIERLEAITEGVIALRRVVEQKYERQKLEAKLRAQRQGLLLHGLSEAQVDEIAKTRRLLNSLTVYAPSQEDCPTCHQEHPFHIQSLNVQVGQQVGTGDILCVLADHCELYIEGTAFETDTQILRDALEAGTPVSADVLVSARREHAVGGLQLLYLSDEVDRQSRALHFYVLLPNQLISDRSDGTRRFLQWRFKPGQRVELSLPVEKWSKRLVVPADAVINDGAEAYVYRQSGEQFERVPVHVEHRDKKSAVIENDGSLFPGEVIAANGAFQIHLAIKNKSGGAIDPHAGHNH